ncbi:hypothetical protein BH09SUM1_BH09SUM1_22710 [soil metagenome]
MNVSVPMVAALGASTEEGYTEIIVWGVVIIGLVLALFIVSKVVKQSAAGKVRGIQNPFGMSAGDIEKMKERGGLTTEELQKIRQTMGRRFIERAKEEEEARSGKAPTIDVLAAQYADAPKDPAPKPPLQRPMAPPPLDEPALPEHLRKLSSMADVQLGEMQTAGFISIEDLQAIRAMRNQQ